jgi:hypothetical protein
MGWWASIVDAVGAGGFSAIFSGISGLIGGYLTKRENRLLLEIHNKHELKMAEVDSKQAEFELQATLEIAKNKLDIAQAEGEIAIDLTNAQRDAAVAGTEAKAFESGLRAAQKPTGFPIIDRFRVATRPLITWSLYIFVITIFILLHQKVGHLVAQDTELLIRIYVYLIQSVIYLFIMAVSWWFMSRGEKSVSVIKGMFSK